MRGKMKWRKEGKLKLWEVKMSRRIVISETLQVEVGTWSFLVILRGGSIEFSFYVDKEDVDRILETGEIQYQDSCYEIRSVRRKDTVEIYVNTIVSGLDVEVVLTHEEFDRLLEIFGQYRKVKEV